MDKVLKKILPGIIAGDFLWKTERVVQAIMLWNECVILLSNKALEIENDFATKLSITLYKRVFYGYAAIKNLSPAIESGKKLLVLLRDCKRKKEEGETALMLATMYHRKCKYKEAEAFLKKALGVNKEINDKDGEATCYRNLGALFQSVGEYAKAEEYLHKALTIKTDIGDRDGEATCYTNLGAVFLSVGEYAKAEEYLHKALTIVDRDREETCHLSLGEGVKAQKYFQNSLEISRRTVNINLQYYSLLSLSMCLLNSKGNISEALLILHRSIQIFEKMHSCLGNKDGRKISFFDNHAGPYRLFSSLSFSYGKPYEALHVAELGRAKALAELMSNRYFTEKEISIDTQSFVGIEEVTTKDGNSTCLYISYYSDKIFLWVLKQSKLVACRRTKLCESYVSKDGKISVDDLFGNESLLRNFHVLPQEQCEDRSLFSSYTNQLTNESNLEDSLSSLRLSLDEDEVHTDPEPPTLVQIYNMLIDPVSDVLEGSEIIVVPDRCFFKVPFAALHDERNHFLSDSFRIRIVPSLTTLKLILDSPADSHSETGALIVGEPRVTDVYFKGELRYLGPLPGAKAEAEMIARLLPESQLLIAEQATRQAVLQRIPSVSLIHFAAHGDAERGEIALTPPDSAMRPPHEADYLLTMTDISQVRLSAKLVVLSCCHTARGQIKTEGVVGIARAFLGSGARSVLVALWALQDDATEQFMRRFYENLVQGETASECLHRAMKWMRNNGFSEVRQWAPFMLIGDDVSFHFGEEK